MGGMHLTPRDLDLYVSGALENTARAAYARHIADCASCRARTHRAEMLERALHTVPREAASRDLADRIIAAVDWRVAQDEVRRKRLPYMAFATLASFIISFWLAWQTVIAFMDDDAMVFLSLYTSRPDVLSAYFSDALFALVESLPLIEIGLTIVAVLSAIVLAQQLVENFRPRVA